MDGLNYTFHPLTDRSVQIYQHPNYSELYIPANAHRFGRGQQTEPNLMLKNVNSFVCLFFC